MVTRATRQSRFDDARGETGLTARELEILEAVARGLSNRAVGKELFLSDQTVKFHLNKIYRKLRVANRTEAAQTAYRLGLVRTCRSGLERVLLRPASRPRFFALELLPVLPRRRPELEDQGSLRPGLDFVRNAAEDAPGVSRADSFDSSPTRKRMNDPLTRTPICSFG